MSSSRGSSDDLGDSWVEVPPPGTPNPHFIKHQLTVDEYLRLLGEAQESNQSSAITSRAGSRRESPKGSPNSQPSSPKSPPNTPKSPPNSPKLLPSSPISSPHSRKSPSHSPKSPPNSPVQTGTPLNVEWQSYYINTESNKEDSDNPNDWSSRPDQLPPKTWSFRPQKRDLLSIRYARVGNSSIFSRKGLCTLFLTNLISLLLGTGVGLWLSKYGFFVPSVKVR